MPRLLKDSSPVECLLHVPITRGWAGDHQGLPPQDWMTVGCGRKQQAVRQLKDRAIVISEGEVEKEWKWWREKLSKEYIEYVRTTKFLLFLCPCCSSHI